jgi:hypothetical protein
MTKYRYWFISVAIALLFLSLPIELSQRDGWGTLASTWNTYTDLNRQAGIALGLGLILVISNGAFFLFQIAVLFGIWQVGRYIHLRFFQDVERRPDYVRRRDVLSKRYVLGSYDEFGQPPDLDDAADMDMGTRSVPDRL